MRISKRVFICLTIVLWVLSGVRVQRATAQSVASGTIEGTVTDPTGGVVAGASVTISNPLTGYTQIATSDAMGAFRLTNLPFNSYHLEVSKQGFSVAQQDVNVRSLVPANVKVGLSVGNIEQSVSVEASTADLLEPVPYAHSDVDLSTLAKLPTLTPASGLSDAIMLSSPGVVADSNGFFHPLGDHAQTSFSIDGQPISDQQSKAFSTQVPVNAIQSMEIVTGTPNAEYGDKTSLVVNATMRSGLGLTKPSGGVLAQYGSFGSPSVEANVGVGGEKVGSFLALNGLRTGRFLDTPEFQTIHATGNNQTIFNRTDFAPGPKDSVHLNTFVARNWFQIPNTLDQLSQDQRQKVLTFNVAPGYQHSFNSNSLLTVNPYVRQDRVNYYPSPDPFDDSPVTVSQNRHLTNWGVRSDVSYVAGIHNVKIGGQVMQTRLNENFTLGITDFTFNPVCLNRTGDPQALPTVKIPAQCAVLGFLANPDLQPGLVPFDFTRGGRAFQFAGTGNVNEYAAYVQDSMTINKLTLNLGLRLDRYDGIGQNVTPTNAKLEKFPTKSLCNSNQDTCLEPRAGISYLIASSGTVLRAGYARTMETPYNENLLVAASGNAQDLIDIFSEEGGAPIGPGHRNQYNIGVQQALGRYVQVDGEYFWKYTNNGYDFGVIATSPIAFPISWPKAKLDGVSLRLSSVNFKGFQGYMTMSHNRARFFTADGSVFRIDHDQVFQQTSNARYQWKNSGPWVGATWRYDSGLVAGAVGSLDDLLALTPAEQAAVGFSCGNNVATPDNGIEQCTGSFNVERLKLPEGEPNDDTNPPRVAPRHVFDLGVGTDNLLSSGDGKRVTLRFTVSNIANKNALYNFQSTFSGTHFIAPRTYTAAIGLNF